MKSSEYYTPAEAADYLKICKATIYKMIKQEHSLQSGQGDRFVLPKAILIKYLCLIYQKRLYNIKVFSDISVKNIDYYKLIGYNNSTEVL